MRRLLVCTNTYNANIAIVDRSIDATNKTRATTKNQTHHNIANGNIIPTNNTTIEIDTTTTNADQYHQQ